MLRRSCPNYRWIIGLTGSIASGKSTAREFLQQNHAKCVDADKLGHLAYKQGTRCFESVVATFGSDILERDGEIDRKKLGPLVFGNPVALKQLTDIVWPEIGRLCVEELNSLAGEEKDCVGVVEAAVLLDANWGVDEIWAAVVSEEEALRRVMERDGIPLEAARARLAAGVSRKRLEEEADFLFDTSGPIPSTQSLLQSRWDQTMRNL